MAETRGRRPCRTLDVAISAALAQSRLDLTLPLLVLVCWVLLGLLITTPRRRRRAAPPDDGWYAPATGPFAESEVPAGDTVQRPRRATTVVETLAASELPTLEDVRGHRLAAAQLADRAASVVRAGARLHERPTGVVLLHGGTPTDRTLMVRAVAGEHGVPVVSVSARALARSPISSAVEHAFVAARTHEPCLFVVTDLDRLGPAAGAPLRRVASDLLTQLRRIEPHGRILVVGLVSDCGDVPGALRDSRAFDHSIAVGTLTATERRRIIIRELALHAAVHHGDLGTSVRATAGVTATQLRDAVANAVQAARVRTPGTAHASGITPRDLRAALSDPDLRPPVVVEAFGSHVARRLQRLLTALSDHRAGPALSVVAAAGNGKTSAARWVTRRSPRPVIWLDSSDLAALTPTDLDGISANAISQAPVLVVIDGVDDALAAYDDVVDRKHVLATIGRLVEAVGTALLVTSSDRWAPSFAAALEDTLDTAHLSDPTYHDRVLLIRHAATTIGAPVAAVVAAELVGATRRQVLDAAQDIDDVA